ncbi:MAG: DUF951 domain-containing protein [Armatimonadota bacterium]
MRGRRPREGDVVRLKKSHPCGTNAWEVMGLGVDIKLRCTGCGHIIRMPRSRFESRVRGYLQDEGESRER